MPTAAATSALAIVAYLQIDSSLLASATVFLKLADARYQLSWVSDGTCAPIENSPPGIDTIPSGAGPGAERLFSTVGRN